MQVLLVQRHSDSHSKHKSTLKVKAKSKQQPSSSLISVCLPKTTRWIDSKKNRDKSPLTLNNNVFNNSRSISCKSPTLKAKKQDGSAVSESESKCAVAVDVVEESVFECRIPNVNESSEKENVSVNEGENENASQGSTLAGETASTQEFEVEGEVDSVIEAAKILEMIRTQCASGLHSGVGIEDANEKKVELVPINENLKRVKRTKCGRFTSISTRSSSRDYSTYRDVNETKKVDTTKATPTRKRKSSAAESLLGTTLLEFQPDFFVRTTRSKTASSSAHGSLIVLL
jgi:hypothetical protein